MTQTMVFFILITISPSAVANCEGLEGTARKVMTVAESGYSIDNPFQGIGLIVPCGPWLSGNE